MNKTTISFSSGMAIAALLISTFFSGSKPAQAITAEEALRLLGVLGRYADDLNRTFPNRQQPTPQVLPSSTPNPFNPSPDNSNPSPFNFPNPQPR